MFSAVRKRSGKIRRIEKFKNESTSASAVVLTGLQSDQGPCPIKSQSVEYRQAEKGEKLSSSLCAARISASTTEALLTFPAT